MKHAAISRIHVLFAVFFFTLVSCGSSHPTPKRTSSVRKVSKPQYAVAFNFDAKLGATLDKARKQGKLVFLDIYTDWCAPCKMMDKDVFTHKETGQYLNDHFVSLKVNAERGNGPNIASLYQVSSYPTLLFLDVDGRVLARKNGAAYHTELRRLGDSALALQAGL